VTRLALGRNAAKNAPRTASTSASIAPTIADPDRLVTGESEARRRYAAPFPCRPPTPRICGETSTGLPILMSRMAFIDSDTLKGVFAVAMAHLRTLLAF
jgi:hypothetical protein